MSLKNGLNPSISIAVINEMSLWILIASCLAEIRDFSRAVCSVYDFSNIRDFYKADIPCLKELIKLLGDKYNDEDTNCTTRIVIKTYKNKLEDKLNLLQ